MKVIDLESLNKNLKQFNKDIVKPEIDKKFIEVTLEEYKELESSGEILKDVDYYITDSNVSDSAIDTSRVLGNVELEGDEEPLNSIQIGGKKFSVESAKELLDNGVDKISIGGILWNIRRGEGGIEIGCVEPDSAVVKVGTTESNKNIEILGDNVNIEAKKFTINGDIIDKSYIFFNSETNTLDFQF